jgi:glycosyltransferase involved in cell wall biosynthesis
MRHNVLHVLGSAQLEGSGIARIVAAVAGGIDPRKYRVHAWFLGPAGPLVEELQTAGATVLAMNWWRGARDPLGAWRFARCLRAHDFAVVHQHFGARSIRRVICHYSDARVVVHLHGCVAESHAAQGVPMAVRGAHVVIAASRAVALQFPAANPIVVYAGVPVQGNVNANTVVPRRTTVIGAACRLIPLKGLSGLIRAAALLGKEFPHLRLEIAGTGPERDNLEREVKYLGLGSQVHFLGWQRNLGTVLRNWDIFSSPSLDEGFGMAVLEAMAGGLPVVGTTVGGLPELIEDGRTGYLVPPSDVAALASRLRLLILDSEGRRAMGAAGRERALRHFSLERMVGEIAAIYDGLLN